MIRVILSLLLFFPLSVRAEDLPPECRLLPAHVANNDVTYQPGVDVHGNKVVPADLNASSFAFPDVVTVPLGIDLAQRLQGLNIQGLQMESPMGILEIHRNGRVVYNGQDWTPQVYAVCGQVPPDIAPAGGLDGQAAEDAIKSPSEETAPKLPSQQPAYNGDLIEGGAYRDEGYR